MLLRGSILLLVVIVLSFLLLYNIPLSLFDSIFISCKWTVGYFKIAAYINNAIMNILMSCMYAEVLTEYLGVKLLGHRLEFIFPPTE